MENEKNKKLDPEKLDMTTTFGCSFKQSKKEALISCAAYVIWGIIMMVSVRIFGYTNEVTYLFGYPVWVIVGIFIPMITWLIWSLIYVFFIFKE